MSQPCRSERSGFFQATQPNPRGIERPAPYGAAMTPRSLSLLGVLLFLGTGCTVTKTQVQMDRERSTFRSPVMQWHMAKVVDEAVRRQDFSALSGHTAVV